jgi:hypothetical protein
MRNTMHIITEWLMKPVGPDLVYAHYAHFALVALAWTIILTTWWAAS